MKRRKKMPVYARRRVHLRWWETGGLILLSSGTMGAIAWLLQR